MLESDSQRLKSKDKPTNLVQLLHKTEKRAYYQGEGSKFSTEMGFAFTEFLFIAFRIAEISVAVSFLGIRYSQTKLYNTYPQS